MILVEKKDNVAVVTLNRPKALNALCEQLLKELSSALTSLSKDNSVGSIVLTGSKKAFAGKINYHHFTNLN
jgi:enoyl-CoA hydratase/carnithine racemase